jgi:hypothetical protein
MAMSAFVLAGVLAMSPQWAIVDLPYPDVNAANSMGGSTPAPEALVSESIGAFVRKANPGKKHEVTQLRIEGSHASARLVFADRTWIIHLVNVNGEWKVVEK